MKVLNLSFADSAGAAWALSHALNKVDGVQSINLRANNNYINYPSLAEMRTYGEEGCRKIVQKSDVVVFHTAILPFFSALHLTNEDIQGKRLMLYFHGSDLRNFGGDIIKQAQEILGNFDVLLSTPDLLEIAPEGTWMPVARSFAEIKAKYSPCKRDHVALEAFGGVKKRVIIGHAPTSEAIKGTDIFLGPITNVVKELEHTNYEQIQNLAWDSCLRRMSTIDVYMDQANLGAYGLAAVETSIFNAAIFCYIKPEVAKVMSDESGMAQPFVQWTDAEDLETKILGVCTNEKLRERFGELANIYCRTMHDDQNVARRFLKLVDKK